MQNPTSIKTATIGISAQPMESRLLMTTFAYLLAVAGVVLVWSPYLFRKFVMRIKAGAHNGVAIALVGSVLGLAMIVLGLVAY